MEKRPRPAWRYVFCVVLLIAVFGAYVLRLYDWQIVNGDTWLTTAGNSTQSTGKISAARGARQFLRLGGSLHGKPDLKIQRGGLHARGDARHRLRAL